VCGLSEPAEAMLSCQIRLRAFKVALSGKKVLGIARTPSRQVFRMAFVLTTTRISHYYPGT